jgi:hypothetical protein
MTEALSLLAGFLVGGLLSVYLTLRWLVRRLGLDRLSPPEQPWWRRDPNRCRVTEETGGYFIGRRHCQRHNVVWDDGGRCPRAGREPGDPFTFARRGVFPGRY